MDTERVVTTAEGYIGFRSRALRTNDFGAKAGHNTEIWAGSFVQTVFQETDNKFPVHFSDTASALNYARLRNLTVKTPQRGDLAFYTFSTDGAFSQPHIGFVTDTDMWKERGIFQAVEGETSPNASRTHVQPADGVWKRSRYATEISDFVRMQDWKPGLRVRGINSEVLNANFTYLGQGKHVETVQRALSDVFGSRLRGVHRGMWDAPTSHAYSEWQRITGVKPTGLPSDRNAPCLELLGVETGRWMA